MDKSKLSFLTCVWRGASIGRKEVRVVQIETNNIAIEKEVSGFKLNIYLNCRDEMSRDSAVGIATGYGLDD
jgi:hypothetical protein